jgi:hypothetical protein
MKTMKKSILLSIVMLAFTASMYGQVSDIATATATVLAPLSITADVDLNFGSFAASTAGTVIVDDGGGRTETGGIALIGAGVTAASFTITGAPTATVAITLPTLPITLTSGGNNMDIIALDPSIATPTTVLPGGGSATLNIGATLDVAAGQPAGVYTNTTDLEVIVNYN